MIAESSDAVTCRIATLAEITPVRFAVLRPGMEPVWPYFEGDLAETTCHFGAFVEGNAEAVGCLTMMRVGEELRFQLRGMAVSDSVQGKGVGAAVYWAAEAWTRANGGTSIWCNARQVAIGFYKRLGFVCISDFFDIPTVGPHKVMEKHLP